MRKYKKRETNIELLRIVAMFLIVMYHVVVHCFNEQLANVSYLQGDNSIFTQPVFLKRMLLPDTIMTFGLIGNSIFVLISGYFLISSKGGIEKAGGIAKKLLMQLAFAAVCLTCFPTLIHWLRPTSSSTLESITDFNETSWFVGYYFVVVICGIFFINRFAQKVSRKNYLALVLTLFALCQFSYSGEILESLAQGLRVILTGLTMYAVGGYIRMYNPFSKWKSWMLLAIIALTYIFVWLSEYNMTARKIAEYQASGSTDPFFQTEIAFPNYSIVVIIIAICVFELFLRLRLPHSGIVNYIGASTFMVYLVHDHDYFYSLWNSHDWVTDLQKSPKIFGISLIKWATLTFLIGIISFCLYNAIITMIKKIADRSVDIA